MSRPSASELTRLRIVAGEIISTLEAEGHAVGQALEQHEAFADSRVPKSSLTRSIVARAACRGASLASMSAATVSGGGLDLISIDGLVERRYRLKVAAYRNDELQLVCGASSALLSPQQEPGLLTVEQWVLCFDPDDEVTTVDIFAAKIVGHKTTGAGPVQLVLGPTYPIGPVSPPDGFTPDHDDDLGEDFGDESDAVEDVA